jgi:hypothetical protein
LDKTSDIKPLLYQAYYGSLMMGDHVTADEIKQKALKNFDTELI